MTKTPDPRSREPEALAWSFSVQVVAQHLQPRRVAQLRHRLRLDLADPLAGDPVDLPDLVQRPRPAVREAEPQPHDTGLALAQRGEHRLQLVLQRVNDTASIGRLDYADARRAGTLRPGETQLDSAWAMLRPRAGALIADQRMS